ncbi:MAG: hypothetical protein EB051_05265, partial [Chlamydiia bacterium]|nr:hypothetical protein [Chlamydiia bacterium]
IHTENPSVVSIVPNNSNPLLRFFNRMVGSEQGSTYSGPQSLDNSFAKVSYVLFLPKILGFPLA